MRSGRTALAIIILALNLIFQNCGGFTSSGGAGLHVDANTDGDSEARVPEASLPNGIGQTLDPGYDIFVIAGQSNSVGYGGGNYRDTNSTPEIDARIFQIGRFAGNDLKVIPANDRLDHWVSHDSAGNPTAGIGMGAAFARAYATGQLKPERKILIVPAGFGGTMSLHWDRSIDVFPAEPNFHDSLMLTDDLNARLQVALTQPGGRNQFVALLWHQGESDVDCLEPGIWCSGKTPTSAAYAARIAGIIGFIRSQVSYPVPAVVGKLVPVWDGGLRPGAAARKAAIESAIVGLPTAVEALSVVDTAGLLANSQAGIGSADNIHFSAQSQIELGVRYYRAFKSIPP